MSVESDIKSMKSDLGFISFCLAMYLVFQGARYILDIVIEVKKDSKIQETK